MNPRTLSESNMPTRTQDVGRTKNGVHRVYAAIVQPIVFQLLRLWAWVELNYRPHAYQAETPKAPPRYLRKILGLPSARFRERRKKRASNGARKRRQGVDSGSDSDPDDSPLPSLREQQESRWLSAHRELEVFVFGKPS